MGGKPDADSAASEEPRLSRALLLSDTSLSEGVECNIADGEDEGRPAIGAAAAAAASAAAIDASSVEPWWKPDCGSGTRGCIPF